MSDGLRIVKMSGAGNDFVVLGPDEARAIGPALPKWVRRVCRRGLSVGADGVLVVEPRGAGVVGVTFYNPDGGIAFCGNGSRCAARYAHGRGWVGNTFVLETAAGIVPAEMNGNAVRISLPSPIDRGPRHPDVEGAASLSGRFVVAGVPHFVVEVESLAEAPLAVLGPALRRHPMFGAEGTNVDLVQRVERGTIRIRTWERGVEGETLSCGTGAVASAFAFRLDGGPETIQVVPWSGVPLRVRLPGSPASPSAAILEGDARFVFDAVLGAESTEGFPPP